MAELRRTLAELARLPAEEARRKLPGLVRGMANLKSSDSMMFEADSYVLVAKVALENGELELAKQSITAFLSRSPPVSELHLSALLLLSQTLVCLTQRDLAVFNEMADILLQAVEMAKKIDEQHPIIANIAQQFYVSSVPFHSQETSHLIRDKLKLMFKEIRNLSPSTVHYPSVMQLGLLLLDASLTEGSGSHASRLAKTLLGMASSAKADDDLAHIIFVLAYRELLDASAVESECGTSAYFLANANVGNCARLREKSNFEASGDIINRLVDSLCSKSPHLGIGTNFGSKTRGTTKRYAEVTERQRCALLVRIAEIAISQKLTAIAEQCMDNVLTAEANPEPADRVKVSVLRLQVSQGSLQPEDAEGHIRVIKEAASIISTALSNGTFPLVETLCGLIWTSTLPAAKAGFRKSICSALVTAAEALNTVKSNMANLRCFIHQEAALAEEDADCARAVHHWQQALVYDVYGEHAGRITSNLKRLMVFINRYKEPSDRIAAVTLIIQKVLKGKLDPGETVKELIEQAVQLLLDGGEALALWLALPTQVKLSKSASTAGIPADASLQSMKSVQVSQTDGHLRLSRIHCALIKSHLINAARNAEMHAVCVQATRDDIARELGTMDSSTDRIERTSLWFDLLRANPKSNVRMSRVIARFAQSLAGKDLIDTCMLCAQEARKSHASSDTDSPLLKSHHGLLSIIAYCLLEHARGLAFDLAQQGVGFLQVPPIPKAVQALVEEEVGQKTRSEKSATREKFQAEQDLKVAQKKEERELALKARAAAEAVLRLKEAEELANADNKGKIPKKSDPKKANALKQQKKRDAEMKEAVVELPVVPEPYDPPEVVVPPLSAERVQELKNQSESYQNWQKYLVYVKELNEEISDNLNCCLDIAIALDNPKLQTTCLNQILDGLTEYQHVPYSNYAAVDPKMRHLYDMVETLGAVSKFVEPILANLLKTKGEGTVSGELLCQLANVMILGTLVPRLPGPPPVSSGEEKKVKAPGKSPPKPTASSVAVPNLVLQPNTFEDYKRAVQLCHSLLSSSLAGDDITLATQQRLATFQVHVKQLLIQSTYQTSLLQLPQKMNKAFDESLFVAFNNVCSLDFNRAPLEKKMTGCVTEDAYSHLSKCKFDASLQILLYQTLADVAFQAKRTRRLVPECCQKAKELEKKCLAELEQREEDTTSDRKNVAKWMSCLLLLSAKISLQQSAKLLLDPGRSVSEKKSVAVEVCQKLHDAACNARIAEEYDKLVAIANVFNTGLVIPLLSGGSADAYTHLINTLCDISKWINDLAPPKTSEDKLLSMGGNDVEIDSLWEKPPCDSVPTSVKSAEEAATVRSSFYAVELKWLYKMGQFEEGVKVADRALKAIPLQFQKSFDAQRLRFKLLLGKPIEKEIEHLTHLSDQVVLWRAVAERSATCEQGVRAYAKLIEVAEATGDSIMVANMLLKYAKWLFQNGFPVSTAVAKVNEAVSVVQRMPPLEEPFPPKEPEPSEQVQDQPSPGKTPKGKKTPQPGKDKGRSSASDKSKESPEISEEESQIQTEHNGLVATIRVELLARAHATIVEIYQCGEASEHSLDEKRQNTVAAARLYYHIWSLATEQASILHRKQPQAVAQSPTKASKDRGKEQEKEKEKQKEEKPKGKKGSKDKNDIDEEAWKEPERNEQFPLPQTASDWAVYELPREALACMTSSVSLPGALNRNTIPDLATTLKTLRHVEMSLVELALSPMAMPLLALERQLLLILNDCDVDALSYVRLRILDLSYKLELSSVVEQLSADGFPGNLVPCPLYYHKLETQADDVHAGDRDIKDLLREHHAVWADWARLLVEMGYLHQGLTMAQAVEKICPVFEDEPVRISLCRTNAKAHLLLGNTKMAIEYSSKGLKSKVDTLDPKSHAMTVDLVTILMEAVSRFGSDPQKAVNRISDMLIRQAETSKKAVGFFPHRKAVYIWKHQVLQLRRLQLYFSALAEKAFPDKIDKIRRELWQLLIRLEGQLTEQGHYKEAVECLQCKATYLKRRLASITPASGKAMVMAYRSQQHVISAYYKIFSWARDTVQSVDFPSGPGKDYTMPCERQHSKNFMDLAWLLMPLLRKVIKQDRSEFEKWYNYTPTEKHISVYVEAPVTEKEPTAGDASDDAAYQYLRRKCGEIALKAAQYSLEFVSADSVLKFQAQNCYGQMLLLLARGGIPPPIERLRTLYRLKVQDEDNVHLTAAREAILARKAKLEEFAEDEQAKKTDHSEQTLSGSEHVIGVGVSDGVQQKGSEVDRGDGSGGTNSNDTTGGNISQNLSKQAGFKTDDPANCGKAKDSSDVTEVQPETAPQAGSTEQATSVNAPIEEEIEPEQPTTLEDLTEEEEALVEMNATAVEQLTQALTCLRSVIAHGLKTKRWDMAAQAYYQIFRLYQYEMDDLDSAVHYLSAYQCCRTAQWLAEVLADANYTPGAQAQNRTSTSLRMTQTSLDLSRETEITSHFRLDSYNESKVLPPVTSDAQAHLSGQQVYQSLDFNKDPLHQIKDFPNNFTFLILQHSPDKSELCAAIVHGGSDVSSSSAPIFGKEPKTSTKKESAAPVLEEGVRPPADVAIGRKGVNMSELRDIIAQAENVQSKLSLAQIRSEQWKKGMAAVTSKDILEYPDIKSQFSEVVSRMNNYVRPCFEQMGDFVSCFKLPPPLVPPEKSPKKGKAAVVQEPEVMPAPQSRYVIVLADSDLSPLPLEALEWLQQDGVKSVSRDFSVNCLHQRMMRVAPPVAQPDEDGGQGGKKPEKDAKGKKSKAEKKGETTQPWPPRGYEVIENPTVSMGNARFMIDPGCHLSTDETDSVTARKLVDCIRSHSSLTAKWTAENPKPNPSSTENPSVWDRTMDTCDGLLLFGCGRLRDMYPSLRLAERKMSGCQVALLLDKMETKASLKWKRESDISQRRITDTLHYAGLLSLAGVGSMVLNAMPCSLEDGSEMMNSMLKGLSSSENLSLGQCVHNVRASSSTSSRDEAQHARSMPSLVLPGDESSTVLQQASCEATDAAPAGNEAETRSDPEQAGDGVDDVSTELRAHSQNSGNANVAEVTQPVSIKQFNYVVWGLPHLVIACSSPAKGQKAGKGDRK